MEVILCYGPIALVCGILASSVTDQRGHGSALGWLLGLLLGPIGLLICAILPADDAGRDRYLLARGQRRKCVRCASLIPSDALVCPYCGQAYDRVLPR